MIITLTPNPSVDATLHLGENLEVGGVNRATHATTAAGGKGVNVARVIQLSGGAVTALFPSPPADPFLHLVNSTGISYEIVPIADRVRVNTTLTEPGGRTTKVNGPGPTLSEDNIEGLLTQLLALAASSHARAAVLAGSLPPGTPDNFYARAVGALREKFPDLLIAVDTSHDALRALGDGFAHCAPNLIKPNGFELGQLAGTDGLDLERSAERGDFGPVLTAARDVVARGVSDVLVTLGGAGAVVATRHGAWHASAPPVAVQSTVGAGDSSLAGYLLARIAGKEPPEALRQAVAYGSAAAGLPGTGLPSPDLLDPDGVTVTALTDKGNP